MIHHDLKKLTLTPSLLERLIDDNPGVSWEERQENRWGITQLIDALRKDLENLLNTRLGLREDIPDDFQESKASLLMYGVPDLTVFNRNSAQDRRSLVQLIEKTVRTFEPRLKHVRVFYRDGGGNKLFEKQLHFTIEGVLLIEPAQERVVFDTQLELNSGTYKIEGVS